MNFIEFTARDSHRDEYIILINPEHIAIVYKYRDDGNQTTIGLASGNPVLVKHSLEEVKKKLGIEPSQ